MPNVKLTGINTVTKKLADGSKRQYFYHRGTGTPLPGPKGSPAFLAAYLEAEKLAPQGSDTVGGLIRVYEASRKFTHNRKGQPKAASTIREYLRMLRELDSVFGTMPKRALESEKVNAIFIDYHEEIAQDRPREADNRMGLLGTVFAEAKRRGHIRRNPLEGFERAYTGDRSEIIWTEADIRRFMRDAPVELQQAMILAIHTGQRYGDLIRLRWSDYDGEVIRLVQSKTKAKVPVPVTGTLRRMLDEMPR